MFDILWIGIFSMIGLIVIHSIFADYFYTRRYEAEQKAKEKQNEKV